MTHGFFHPKDQAKSQGRSPLMKAIERQGRWIGVAIATLLMVCGVSFANQGWAQTPQESPPPDMTNEATATPSPTAPSPLNLGLPPEISSLLETRWNQGLVQRTVWLDGSPLFQLAGTSVNNGPAIRSGGTPLDNHVRQLEQDLQRIASSDFDPRSLEVSERPENGLPVLQVSYTVDGETRTEDLLTVTQLDVQNSSATSEQVLANQWASILEDRLIQAYEERQPDFLRQQVQYAAGIVLVMIVLSMTINHFLARLSAEREALQINAEHNAQQLSSATGDTGSAQPITTALLVKQRMAQQQKRSFNELERRFLQLGQVANWSLGLYIILGLFPQSRWLQPAILNVVKIPGKIVLIVILAYVAVRISSVLIDRFFWVLQSGPNFTPERSQRRALRFSTFSTVAKGVVAFIASVIGVVVALSAFGVNVAPLVAGAGILGLAVSFAAQNLIKDVINGFLILVEDQYGVGDVVILGDIGGFVEYMGLRITQLRNEEGRLITVPNGTITVVQNLTKEWSRVDLLIDVDHSANIDEAIALIKQIADDMTCDPQWKPLILDPPLLLGVDSLSHIGATVRMWIKTQPLKQWDVGREYRRRLKIAFDQAGISIGAPQQSIRFNTSLNVQPPARNSNGHLTSQTHEPTFGIDAETNSPNH